MKKRYILAILIAFIATLSLSQATASGLKYDPVANYYNTYYDMDSFVSNNTPSTAIKAEVKSKTPVEDPYDAYYNVFYEMAEEGQVSQSAIKQQSVPEIDDALMESMSDPLNYYKW
ncbi:MAG TPA: hypothetical protein EYG68_10860 [Leucothrix mucor]|nr:hypothetical protein [Leucothrix mucor]